MANFRFPTGVFLVCPICNKQFYVKKSFLTKVKGKSACGNMCRGKMRAKQYIGENNPNWRGGGMIASDGRLLVYAPGHINAHASGGPYILEYRLMAESMIGRSLRKNEVVHHKNGDATDNRPENLEVMTAQEHARLHVSTRRDNKTGRFAGEKSAL